MKRVTPRDESHVSQLKIFIDSKEPLLTHSEATIHIMSQSLLQRVEIPIEPRASFLCGSYCFCQRTWQPPPFGWPWFPVWLHRVICRLTLPYSLTVLQICFQYVTTQYGANPGDRSPSTVASLSNSAAFLVMFWNTASLTNISVILWQPPQKQSRHLEADYKVTAGDCILHGFSHGGFLMTDWLFLHRSRSKYMFIFLSLQFFMWTRI